MQKNYFQQFPDDNGTKLPIVFPPYRFSGRRRGKALSPRQKSILQQQLPLYQLLPNQLLGSQTNQFWQSYRHWCLEIGFGAGENLFHWAKNKQAMGFIGAEPFQYSLVKLMVQLAEQQPDVNHQTKWLNNLFIYPDDARDLLPYIPANILDEIWLLFPDPWRKPRHRSRRIIAPHTVQWFSYMLKPKGLIYFATDHPALLHSSMVYMAQNQQFRWLNASVKNDWQHDFSNYKMTNQIPPLKKSLFSNDNFIYYPTRYEQKAIKKASPITYLIYQKQ